ncbi:liprin-beta-2 isoform X3 [Sitophilus oryzae]|uniref:Liprin-beta-2 isoform X3 n=1 Tax=Sitophilus oryzae TaxID=7048 RepID=A0A6J2YX84_SITOR|nr:liprin-beta-2 isoform X3 [Sitophilus oryzae]
MREVCKSGAVVAAVVAVLEKQTRQFSPPPKLPPKPPKTRPILDGNSPTRKPTTPTNSDKSASKNSQDAIAEHRNFELAVKDFDSVVADVERTFCSNSAPESRKPSSISKISRQSACPVDGDVPVVPAANVSDSGDVTHGVGEGEVRRVAVGRNCVTIDFKSEGGGYEEDENTGKNDEEKRSVTTSNSKNHNNNFTSSFNRYICEPEELVVVLGYDQESADIDSDSLEASSDSEGECFINHGLATIAEEERISASSAQSSRGGDDSSIEDESTLKDRNQEWSGSNSIQEGSTSDLSTSSSERNGILGDSGSTRCTNDFQWIRKEPPAALSPPRASPQRLSPIRMEEESPPHEPAPLCKPPISRSLKEKVTRRSSERSGAPTGSSAPGSLDRRRHHLKREERDQKSRSSHVKSPPRLEDFQPNLTPNCQNGFCYPPTCGPYDGYMESFHRRHERSDPQRYGSSPMLMDHREHRLFSERGSHPDIYGDCSRYRHEMACCSYHMGPPPCCFYGGDRGYHWTPPPYPKPGEQDEKFRKIQYERDNLQLQVQVLTEQIEAQSDKITDLEKVLHEKKQMLSEAEEKLQREVLSRSSLETQKLELMSIMSELKLNAAALERENMELRNCPYNNNSDLKKPPLVPRIGSSSQPQLTSTPQHSSQGIRVSPSPSPVGLSTGSTRNADSTLSYQNDILRPKTPPSSYKRQIDIQYGSLPRQQFLTNGSGTNFSVVDSNANPQQKKGVAFGRNSSLQHLPLVAGGSRMRGFSVPNLAETERTSCDDVVPKGESPGSPTLSFNKNKGIKKLFGKMKRSGSGNLEDLPPGIGDFQRGGVRATAAARLGWSEPHLTLKCDKPFAEWDTENICDWLQDMGLDQYITDAKRWVKSGSQLQESPITEIEKELNIKNPLHRKKLQLALIDTTENSSSDPYLSEAGKLDTAWVLRWLDDAGLPQHKENFLINRVDGRVLHRLTIDDLALLHVTSLLHVASIKRGIQVLRENNYESGCLQRRSLPDDPETPTPKQISLWTTHRVMEWLRAVDLAEYAPNLRGAGVHGGLMVLEPKFNADLLASLLSIPPGKTLLRRHLNTHFKELLGKDIIQEKRELEATMGYIPLTPSSKLKIAKKSQFSLKRKKSKGEADYGDLVCPLNPDKQSGDLSSSSLNMGIPEILIIHC